MSDSQNKPYNPMDTAALGLLREVEREDVASQRDLSSRLGVALGLTNTLIKRAIRKGYIKVRNAPAKRYAYYLTPQGFSEKTRLVAEYLSSSLDFFRLAREAYEKAFKQAQANGWKTVVLVGDGELAEIAVISALDWGISIVAIVDPHSNVSTRCGVPVIVNMADVSDCHCAIVTDARKPQSAYDAIIAHVPEDRVIAPAFLHITRVGDGTDEGGSR